MDHKETDVYKRSKNFWLSLNKQGYTLAMMGILDTIPQNKVLGIIYRAQKELNNPLIKKLKKDLIPLD